LGCYFESSYSSSVQQSFSPAISSAVTTQLNRVFHGFDGIELTQDSLACAYSIWEPHVNHIQKQHKNQYCVSALLITCI